MLTAGRGSRLPTAALSRSSRTRKVTFRNNGGDWRDLVDVWLGRIRVHIQKLGGEPNPNRVHTPTAVISVRGTTFDVSVNDDDETTFVAVEEGVVTVEHRLMPREGGPKVLKGGDSLVSTATCLSPPGADIDMNGWSRSWPMPSSRFCCGHRACPTAPAADPCRVPAAVAVRPLPGDTGAHASAPATSSSAAQFDCPRRPGT